MSQILQRAALFIAHPGHELRVHGWLARARPRVLVLTDGAGRTGTSRLPSTARVVEAAGGRPGSVFGRLSDPELYAALLRGDRELFVRIAEEVAADHVAAEVRLVAADAAEGYNPAHDLCRVLADAAVAIAESEAGHAIASFDFLLIGPPDRCPDELRRAAIRVELDDEELARKEAAAHGYPELTGEVDAAMREVDPGAFRTELLRPADAPHGGVPPEIPPFYERYGEQQVAAGYYRDVLRWRQHVLPIARALERRAGISLTSGIPCGS